MNDVKIRSNSVLSHSVIGKGTIIDHGFSSLIGESKKYFEHECIKIKDIGVMISEDSSINSHVVTNPGVIIGRHCHIYPLKQIQHDITSETKVM